MKKLTYALCMSLCFAIPSFAQTHAAAPSGDEQGAGGKGAKNNKMQEIVQACRKQVRGQGMTPGSKEMKQAVMDCVGKEHPGMARMMGCRHEGKDKGLKQGSDEMKSFVKDCMHKNS